MQRRAAAVYFVIFVALAGGAYAFIQVGATQPEISIDGPTYAQGDSFSVDGRTYTVTGISAESGEDGISRSGELTWFNESNMQTAELENGSTIPFRDDQYTVNVANESNVSSFQVVEALNVSAIIADDPDAETTVTTDDGERFVRFTNGSTQLLSEYLPTAQTETFATGETFPYTQENATIDTTVASISAGTATLEWSAPANQTVGLEDGGNVTLNGQTYFAHFKSNSSVQVLSADQYFSEYLSDQEDIESFDKRINGLWGIVILSILASLILVAAAYLPNKS